MAHLPLNWDNIFSIFVFYFCSQKNAVIFFTKKFVILLQRKTKKGKKKDFCGRPSGHDLGHPLDRKQTFFKGRLNCS